MSEVSLKQRIGEMVTEFFILRNIETRTKKSDNMPYLVLELGYPHGRIWAYIWDNIEAFLGEYAAGDIVKVQGIVDQYREITQIQIKKIRKAAASDDVAPEDLLPRYHGDLTALKKRMKKIIQGIGDNDLRDICSAVLLESDFSKQFCSAPGGKLWHHCYIGGLLEHTVTVAEICIAAARQYPLVDADMLCAGALLHDVGKVDAYKTTPYIDYSDEGRLSGHVVLGYSRVRDAVKKLKEFPEEKSKQLLHLILSHQGELEKASPVVPMTIEAVILHFADEIDSTVNAALRIRKEQKTPRRRWSNYVNLLDRFLYFGDTEKP